MPRNSKGSRNEGGVTARRRDDGAAAAAGEAAAAAVAADASLLAWAPFRVSEADRRTLLPLLIGVAGVPTATEACDISRMLSSGSRSSRTSG